MNLNSLHDLFVHQLKDLYDAERQITDALPKMANAASSPDLRDAFQLHLEQSREHMRRLDQVFNEVGASTADSECEAMRGLVKEGEKVIQARGNAATKDAGLIASAQRVEHYEIAGYGTVRTYARELGYNRAADLLQQTLDEESETDEKLTQLAEGGLLQEGINVQAERQQ